jgi:hypothetical protein
VFWNTGNVDLFTVVADTRSAFALLVAGWIAVVIGAVVISGFVVLRRRRRRPA